VTGAATVPAVQAAPSRDTLHLWGAPAAGKTGLLGALYATSKSREPERWEAHPKDCRDAYTQEQLLDAYEQLVDRAVAKTDVRKDGYRPLEFLLRRHRRGAPTGETLRLSLVDPAGEYTTRTELGHTEHGRALFARVAHGGGLLWLFSADAPQALDRLVVLRHLVALLEQAGAPQLAIPVGLGLSKVDALSPARREAAIADPRAALLEHLGATTFTWFEAACPRLRCFALSSAGTEPGRVRPVGLLETLSWFAEQIGAARAAEAAPVVAPAASVAPADPFATIEVPAVRPAMFPAAPPAAPRTDTARADARAAGGLLGALASRLASAGAVPTASRFAPHASPDAAPVAPSVAPPDTALGAVPRAAAPGLDPAFARTPVAPQPVVPPTSVPPTSDDDEPPAFDRVDGADDDTSAPLRARFARAAASGALALAALGAGAFAGRAAVRAAGERWQPPDAPPAAVRADESPAARRFREELDAEEARDAERDALLRDLREAAEDPPPYR
jgi:hypothetical protein